MSVRKICHSSSNKNNRLFNHFYMYINEFTIQKDGQIICYSVISKSFKGVNVMFNNLTPGTVITIRTQSGDTIGPAHFVTFDEDTGIVILNEFSSVTPGDGTVVWLLADRAESIRFE
jgi:uncharacterized protein YrrD